MLKIIKLKNTNTKPIVCVNNIRKFDIAYKIKFFLIGFLMHFIVYKRLNAEKRNSTEYNLTSCE